MYEVTERITGPLAPIMTAFDADGGLDLDSTCRWVEWMIDRGIRLFWTTQGTTHYQSFTDQEIVDLNRAVAGVVRGRGVLIASTAMHWPVERCRQFIVEAAGWGVDVVKLQLNWYWTPTDADLLAYYGAIARNSPLPLFAYTMTQPGITTGMLRQILEMPQFIGMKNDSGDFYEHAGYLRAARECGRPEFRALTGGSMTAFLFGYELGARAYADVTGWYKPELALEFHRAMVESRRDRAIEIIKTWEEPFFEQYRSLGANEHWAFGHTMLMLRGFFKSNQMRFPLHALSPTQVEKARQFAQRMGLA